MRVHLKIKSSNQIIPFDHQPLLTGIIHKWLGWNDVHGKVSLYSFSQLEGGKATPEGLEFENGTSFFFSSYNVDLIKKLITGIRQNPELFFGLTVSEINIQEDPDFTDRELFFVASPIFIKRRVGEKVEHIRFNDSRANSCLIETLRTKMNEAGLSDETLSISFDNSSPKSRTKMINYNGIKNKVNWCHVIIKGKPETKLFAWNVGLGNSTGIGFGSIK